MPAVAPSPRPRSPVQAEAARRNGARSHGPVTAEGKRRSSANALKHGLAALHHLVLDDEDPGELEGLTGRLLAEIGPEDELEARLVRRLAVAFWKGEPAERMADGGRAPRRRPGDEAADAGRDVGGGRRGGDLRRQAAQRGPGPPGGAGAGDLPLPEGAAPAPRESLTAEDEPETRLRNEPNESVLAPAPAANDDGPRHGMEPISDAEDEMPNEPGASPAMPAEPDSLEALRQAIRAEVAAQTEAEEPDPERIMALTRRLSLATLRLGRTILAAAA
jgi:hypothetical protein